MQVPSSSWWPCPVDPDHRSTVGGSLTGTPFTTQGPAFTLPPTLAASPVRFLRELQAQEVDEGTSAHLHCELSQEAVSVEWRKGSLQLFPCAKYQMVQEGTTATLLVREVEQEDAGEYICDAGHAQSIARLSVRGELPVAVPSPLLLLRTGDLVHSESGDGTCDCKSFFLLLSPQAQVQGWPSEHTAGSRGRGPAVLSAERD